MERGEGALGHLTQILASWVGPVSYMMQYQWLALLSFTDDQVLAITDIVEALWPPSSIIFNKMDHLGIMSEQLPNRIDAWVIDGSPMIVSTQNLLELASSILNSSLCFLSDIVPIRFSMDSNPMGEEKDDDDEVEETADDKSVSLEEDQWRAETLKDEIEKGLVIMGMEIMELYIGPPSPTSSSEETMNKDVKSGNVPAALKTNNLEVAMVKEVKPHSGSESSTASSKDVVVDSDPILELFEAGWHMKPALRTRKLIH
ncbi:hypothetical protein AMTR_s00005p00253060 [Amborella trichopoda]|uniref:Uncharacterized protein n=2 Tax=Amborella trichopoda TaxID=13333 RepID=W1PIF4_AMBTC|nr:hypothetical protein AMTR_s00005p00253060 [Amborella trichopoda]